MWALSSALDWGLRAAGCMEPPAAAWVPGRAEGGGTGSVDEPVGADMALLSEGVRLWCPQDMPADIDGPDAGIAGADAAWAIMGACRQQIAQARLQAMGATGRSSGWNRWRGMAHLDRRCWL